MTEKKGRVYFPNLNGLRFIAAFLVIIHHTEQLKNRFGIENYYGTSPFVSIIGKLGVVLFFVLSGFLITYLLFEEEKEKERVSIKNFYLRRVFRIWPLYYLIVFAALFIIPNVDFFSIPGVNEFSNTLDYKIKVLLFLLILPNMVLAFGPTPFASHTWSIGTEEQFYIVWPVIFKFLKLNRLFTFSLVVILYLIFEKFLYTGYSDFIPYRNVIRAFWGSFNISCMAIGAVYATMLFNKHYLIKFITNRYFFTSILFVTITMICLGVRIPKIHYEFYSILFGIIILNLAMNKSYKNVLENSWFNYLGNISYGLYMYHTIAIVISLKISMMLCLTENWLIYPLCIFISIFISHVSYKYFETFFLKMKNKFL